jgi:hypothetical protein
MNADRYIESLKMGGQLEYKLTAPFRVKVPHGKSGPWKIAPMKTDVGLEYLRCARDGRPPGLGVFTKLVHKDRGIVMSDTVPEIMDLRRWLGRLEGDVLITGLGLGMALHALCKTPRPLGAGAVRSITVVEIDRHVLKLSADYYRKMDKRITIVQGDAYVWKPAKGQKFDSAWHDIWDYGGDSDLYKKIKRHYRPYMRTSGHQFCWGQSDEF